MEPVRAFIAIEIPEEIRRQLDEVMHKLQERCTAIGGESARRAVRWVPSGNIHITLKFLGDVPAGNIAALARTIQDEAARRTSFPFRVSGLGAFPNQRRPKVIWVGSETPTELIALQKAIDTSTQALGYPGEDRPFSPHLTLGRLGQQAGQAETAAITKVLEAMKVGELGIVQVDQIHLFRSDLKPSGAVYTSLHAFPLGKVSS